jgi:ribonuclease E
VAEDAEIMLQLVEVDRYDAAAAVGKLDGLDVVVADAASLVGKRLKVRVERVLDGRAYAVPIRKAKEAPEPLTAEGEAEKPTRKPPARKGATPAAADTEEAGELEEAVVVEEPESDAEVEETEEAEGEEAPKPKKKTRRGSRGGRKRKKPASEVTAEVLDEAGRASLAASAEEVETEVTTEEFPEPSRAVTIHIPGEDLGRKGAAEPAEEPPAEAEPKSESEPASEGGEETPKPKKKTRRGSRGGRNRKKKPATASQNGAEEATEPEAPTAPESTPEAESPSDNGDFEYVPMSEWADEIESGR